jgi:hypothetical protein
VSDNDKQLNFIGDSDVDKMINSNSRKNSKDGNVDISSTKEYLIKSSKVGETIDGVYFESIENFVDFPDIIQFNSP